MGEDSQYSQRVNPQTPVPAVTLGAMFRDSILIIKLYLYNAHISIIVIASLSGAEHCNRGDNNSLLSATLFITLAGE